MNIHWCEIIVIMFLMHFCFETIHNLWLPHLYTEINALTYWGRVTHICVDKLTIIGSDNGLSPDRRQAIIWTIAGISLIRPFGTNFIEILIEIHAFSFKKMYLKMSSGKWRPFCLGLNVLNCVDQSSVGSCSIHLLAFSQEIFRWYKFNKFENY